MGLDKYIPGSAQGVLANPLVIDITYAELVDKISLSALIPGQKYRITDYRTAYNMPNVTPAEKIVCTVEPLLVTANSVNTLSVYAYSEAFPQDEIYYDIANNQTMVPGCDMGYIYRRVDKSNNNDIGFDYRSVKFRRWQIDVTATYDVGTTYGARDIVLKPATAEIWCSLRASNVGNSLTESKWWTKLAFANLTYISPTPTSWELMGMGRSFTLPCTALYQDYYMFTTAPTIAGVTNITNVTFTNIAKLTTGIISNRNTVVFRSGVVTSNAVLGGFSNCSLYDLNKTTITDTLTNTLGGFNRCNIFYLNNTVIGLSCQDNTLKGSSSYNNLLGTSFQYNTLTELDSSCIAHYCLYNTIYGISGSTIGTYFQRNYGVGTSSIIGVTLGDNSKFTFYETNFSSVNCSSSTKINVDTIKRVFMVSSGTYYLNYYDSNRNLITVNAVTDAVVSTKEYTALITQASTDAPVATALTNGLSAAIVWARTSAGVYTGTLAGAFTENKTVFAHSQLPVGSVSIAWTSADVVTITAKDAGGSVADDLLTKFSLTIKVYP